jgi:hypothetical protein
MRRVHPDFVWEYRDRFSFLHMENPLPEPAQSVG